MKRVGRIARLIIVALIWALLPFGAMSAQAAVKRAALTGGPLTFGIAGLPADQQGLGVMSLRNFLATLPGLDAPTLAPAAIRVQGPHGSITDAQAQALVSATFRTFAGAAASPILARRIYEQLRTVEVVDHPELGARTADALAAAVKNLPRRAVLAALHGASYNVTGSGINFDGRADRDAAQVAAIGDDAGTAARQDSSQH